MEEEKGGVEDMGVEGEMGVGQEEEEEEEGKEEEEEGESSSAWAMRKLEDSLLLLK